MRLAPGGEVRKNLAVAARHGIVMLELAPVAHQAHQSMLVVYGICAADVGMIERCAPARLPESVALHSAIPVHRHVGAEALAAKRLRGSLGPGVGTLQLVGVDDLQVNAVISRT